MTEQPLCFFSIMRYVADPIRDEARNIGVVLLSPERGFGKLKFHLPGGLHIQRDTRRYAVLRSIIQGYQIDLPGDYKEKKFYGETLFSSVPPQWTREDLERLHEDCANLIQFSKPAAILGEPEKVLNQLFERQVQAKKNKTNVTQPKRIAAQVFRKTFHPYGLDGCVEENIEIPVGQHRYQFDLGIKNGNLRYAIKTFSFQRTDLQRVEEAGGYYAYIWQMVRDETGAKGLWLVEPPKPSTAAFDTSQEHFQLVTNWAVKAGVEVRDLNETKEIAEEIVGELAHIPSHDV